MSYRIPMCAIVATNPELLLYGNDESPPARFIRAVIDGGLRMAMRDAIDAEKARAAELAKSRTSPPEPMERACTYDMT